MAFIPRSIAVSGNLQDPSIRYYAIIHFLDVLVALDIYHKPQTDIEDFCFANKLADPR